MKKKALSNSSVTMYNTCGKKYKLHYIDKLRSKYLGGALLFGRAIDGALNILLETRNLEQAKNKLIQDFTHTKINNEIVHTPYSPKVVYAAKDFDRDLITPAQETEFITVKETLGITRPGTLVELTLQAQEIKEQSGLKSLTNQQRAVYSFGNWCSMLTKGMYMLEAYHNDVLPLIKEVIPGSIQKRIDFPLTEEHDYMGYQDFIVVMQDGKVYVADNKTSAMEYDLDSAGKSPQLISYFKKAKTERHIDGVAFFVLMKQLNKNKKKKCSVCKFNGTGGNHRSCPNGGEGFGGKKKDRCGGEWVETINPKARIEIILNEIQETAEDLVLETLQAASNGITKGVFNPNLSACKRGSIICDYYDYCWRGKKDDIENV